MKTLLRFLSAACLAALPGAALAVNAAPVAAPDAPPAGAFVSPSLGETIRMIRAGVDDTVLFAFLQNSTGTLNLGADQIVFLRDLGASPELLDAMIQHDREISLRAVRVSNQASPPPASIPWRELSNPALPEKLAAATLGEGYSDLATELAPYGQWFEMRGYGWCWRPWIATMRPTWRPYGQEGRWLATDHGWYWESDFSWGAIVFHYGRWFHDEEAGWCWWPDTRWAPAWVTWRTGPDVVAWAPLPPGSDFTAEGQKLAFLGDPVAWNYDFQLTWEDYVYVPWELFYSEDPGRNRFRGESMADAYWNTSPWNDFFVSGDGKPNNRGASLAAVTRASGMVLQTIVVQDVALTAGRTIEPDRIATDGGQVRILHPCAGGQNFATTPVAGATASPLPAANSSPRSMLPVFATPWRGPANTAPEVAPPSAFERFAQDLLDHPTYEPAPEQPASVWPTRPSEPVKLTDPILSPRPYSSATANITVIRWFPR